MPAPGAEIARRARLPWRRSPTGRHCAPGSSRCCGRTARRKKGAASLRNAIYQLRSTVRPLATHLARDVSPSEVRGIAEIIIGKDRYGPGGTEKVHWDAERMRFENLVPTSQFGEQS